MNILYLAGYFFPENTAYTHLENDLLDELCLAGHTVTVICPVPTRGIDEETRKKYKNIKKEELNSGKIKVIRFSAPDEGKNPIIRAFRYFWCNYRTLAIAKKQTDADVVFAASTPPTQGLLGGAVAKKLGKKLKKHIPFVYNLQDIFPDSLVTTGLSSTDSPIFKVGKKIEAHTYKSADKIILISESFKNNLLNKGVPEEKIENVSNWIDANSILPIERDENRLFEELSLPREKFTVVYAGNFGEAQGAEVVLDAAKLLKDDESIQFAVFGGGAGFENAKKRVADENLSNVKITDLLEQARVPEVYSLGDVALITCKKGVGKSGMPSKTWSIMACNTPIIASFDTDSELADIIKTADAGFCVEPENAEMLKEAILSAKENRKNECTSRMYVLENASKDVCAKKYVKILENSLCNG